MKRDELIEAMARALCPPVFGADYIDHRLPEARKTVALFLTALERALPGLGELIEGTGVVVPAKEQAWIAFGRAHADLYAVAEREMLDELDKLAAAEQERSGGDYLGTTTMRQVLPGVSYSAHVVTQPDAEAATKAPPQPSGPAPEQD